MKKLSIILSLFSAGILISSCRQASFIAEDDVYSTGSSMVYRNDKSDASYSNYVYTKESTSGTKSAYYNPEDSVLRDNQSGTVINNHYYGNDYLYNNNWYGYNSFGFAPRYRPYSVWWGWGYDPFFYSPWHYGWGMGYGMGWGMGYGMHYGWGMGWGMHYGWGYNPYAWGHGYGYNPYGWGYGHGGYGNTIIYGNVYNNYGGGSGMATQNSGGYIQSGNKFTGKRPVMAGNSAPYTGPNKTKSAINNASGKPVKVEKLTPSTSKAIAEKPGVTKGGNEMQASRVNTHQLTSNSKPWVPETKTRPEVSSQSAISKGSDTPHLIERGGNEVRTNANRVKTGESINRPNVPTSVRPNEPSRVNPNASGNVGRDNQSIQRRENVAPQQNNQWNRGTTTPPRTSPQSTPRNNNMSQPSRGGSYNNSPTPSRGGSIGGGSSPSRGSSMGGGSSPSRGSSMGGGSSPSRGSSGGGSMGGSRGGGRP